MPSVQAVAQHLERDSRRRAKPANADVEVTFEGVRLWYQNVFKCNTNGVAANLFNLHLHGGHEFSSRFFDLNGADSAAARTRSDVPAAASSAATSAWPSSERSSDGCSCVWPFR